MIKKREKMPEYARVFGAYNDICRRLSDELALLHLTGNFYS